MGVYIKNITKERAERCFQFAWYGWCIEEMPEIIELPPHGRLIDADELYRRIKTECNPYGKPTINFADGNKVMDMIEAAPTIIPAEEE